jgi:gliding motility-associated protein GldE
LLDKPKKLLATLLVANNFINIGVVILFSVVGSPLFESIASPVLRFVIEVVLVTFLILLFGEVLPKVYANRNNLKFAQWVVYPLSILDKILSPISIPMRAVSIFLHEQLGKQKTNFSVDQLSQALELTSSDDTSQQEQKILEGIVSFGNTDTKQVMSPRIDLFALEISETFSEILIKITDKGYSRIPVYRDHIDQIEGVLFVKDLLPYIHKKEFNWTTLLREPFFVPENKKLDNLLQDFQRMKSHLAVVVDEYGGTSGVVSLEDVIEEIVGDISDEFDDENIHFSQIDEQNFLFEGKVNLKDFYRITGVHEDLFETHKGEAETLAGFILEVLGHFPKKGQKIQFESYRFTIESLDKKRIKQIKITLE